MFIGRWITLSTSLKSFIPDQYIILFVISESTDTLFCKKKLKKFREENTPWR